MSIRIRCFVTGEFVLAPWAECRPRVPGLMLDTRTDPSGRVILMNYMVVGYRP